MDEILLAFNELLHFSGQTITLRGLVQAISLSALSWAIIVVYSLFLPRERGWAFLEGPTLMFAVHLFLCIALISALLISRLNT